MAYASRVGAEVAISIFVAALLLREMRHCVRFCAAICFVLRAAVLFDMLRPAAKGRGARMLSH